MEKFRRLVPLKIGQYFSDEVIVRIVPVNRCHSFFFKDQFDMGKLSLRMSASRPRSDGDLSSVRKFHKHRLRAWIANPGRCCRLGCDGNRELLRMMVTERDSAMAELAVSVTTPDGALFTGTRVIRCHIVDLLRSNQAGTFRTRPISTRTEIGVRWRPASMFDIDWRVSFSAEPSLSWEIP